MHKVVPRTTSYYKSLHEVLSSTVLLRATILAQITFSVLLRTAKLAQTVLPRTTSYYKACAKYFPVLLCTTKLAQGTSQYYFELHWEILLRTTRLAQSTLPYYFVLQSLHKVLPRSTSYYKACTKYFPILLLSAKLAQIISRYYFALQSLHKILPVLLHTLKLAQKVLPTFVTPERQPHETRFPPSTPGASFFEKTQGLVRFLQSKHHLDTAVPLRSALPALQITLQLHRAPFCAPPFCSLHIRTLPHPYSLTSLLCPSPISAHPYSLHL